MSFHNLYFDAIAFLFALYATAIIWFITGSMGYVQLRWLGVAFSGVPALIIGVALYCLLQRLLKEIYSENEHAK